MSDATIELLPCPFCGAQAEMCIGLQEFVDVEIRCLSCCAQTGNYGFGCDDLEKNKLIAISAWNTRAKDTTP